MPHKLRLPSGLSYPGPFQRGRSPTVMGEKESTTIDRMWKIHCRATWFRGLIGAGYCEAVQLGQCVDALDRYDSWAAMCTYGFRSAVGGVPFRSPTPPFASFSPTSLYSFNHNCIFFTFNSRNKIQGAVPKIGQDTQNTMLYQVLTLNYVKAVTQPEQVEHDKHTYYGVLLDEERVIGVFVSFISFQAPFLGHFSDFPFLL